MASSSPFPSGPPRPRPGFAPPGGGAAAAPQPDPAVIDAFRNLQINRPPPPSSAPRPGAPPPSARPVAPPPGAAVAARPGPPPPFASRPPPPGAVAASAPLHGGITSNGPPAFGPAGLRGPQPPTAAASAQQSLVSPPMGVSAAIGGPSLGTAAPLQAPAARPASFPGSPPAGPPVGISAPSQPFSGPASGAPISQLFAAPPSSRQYLGPPMSQPFTVPPASQPFAGQPPGSQPFGVQAPSSQTFVGPTSSSQPLGGPPQGQQPFGTLLTTSQPFGAPPAPSQPYTDPQFSQPYAGMPSSQPLVGRPPLQPFSGPTSGIPFGGGPAWQSGPGQIAPPMPGSMQAPVRMFGMPPRVPGQAVPPVPPAMGHAPLAGSQVSTPSKIDPTQIPRPVPSSSVLVFETRQGNQTTIPPPATSNFVVKDNGNCSPRLMRCTMNQIPCTGDLLTTSSMPLALMVQPLALQHPSEEPIQIVDFGESGPIRCSRCKGYMNPFMRFLDQGRKFICNLCGFTNETPREYYCHLGPDGRRRDADERPELCRGTVEFVATKEYMVRDPMPAVFFFLIDVSMNAIQTGATAAACSAIRQAISDLPEGPRTLVGVATFDSTIHFYNLKRASQQPLMLIVPDVQDVYTPLHTDIIVQVTECRQSLEQLLEDIPSMFVSNKVADSAFGAAVKAGFLAMKPTGGKLLVFQSVLPSVGIGSLFSREAEGRANISSGEKEAHKLLQPADKTLKTMAIEFAEQQVCVDLFITTQSFVDVASLSVVPRTTGGQVYLYYPFSALSDPTKLYNDLRWNISRPQGFEAVMRVRCSQGLQVQEYSGNFCKRIPTDIDLPAIDCDKTIMVTFKHDDKFQENSECAFQCALLYTTIYGQRRIRVINLSLACTSTLGVLFRSADLDTQFACFLKQAANGIPESPIQQVRDQIMNLCINILHSYRKFCATVSSSGQLILPEALKLLPLYTLALIKSIGLRNEGRLDDRSYWVSRVASLSVTLAVPLVYPRMISIHDLASKEDGSLLSSTVPLSSEHLIDEGIYLLENGDDGLIYVGNMVKPETLKDLFGVSSVDGIPLQLVLEQFDNDLSKKLNDLVNEISRQRCSYLRLRLCRKGDPSGMFFMSYMVEDKNPGGLSYVEFLVHVHRQIQTKMS